MTIEIGAVWLPAISALIPLLTAAAVRQDGTNRQRAIIAIIASAVLAAAELAVTGSAFTPNEYAATFITVLIVEITAYTTIWGPLVNVNDRCLPDIGIPAVRDTPGMSAG